MPADGVLGKMEDAGNPVNIVVLDACHNNPFSRGFRSQYQGLAQIRSPKGSIITYATAPGEVAADGQGRNGLYTKHLLRHMRTRGVKIEELFKRVREDVYNESGEKRLPWTSSSIMGDFSFATGSTTVNTVPSQPAGGDALQAERERLERTKQELETLKAKIGAGKFLDEERERIEAERQRLEEEKQQLLAMAKRPEARAPSDKKISNGLGMEFVWIAPGSFEMDSPPGGSKPKRWRASAPGDADTGVLFADNGGAPEAVEGGNVGAIRPVIHPAETTAP